MTIIPSPKILLVGAGNMAREYAKVLKALKQSFLVVGRSKENALIFEKITSIPAIFGGLKNYLETKFPNGNLVSKAIVATNEEQLGPSARLLIQHGIKTILLEKPGGLNLSDLAKTEKSAAAVLPVLPAKSLATNSTWCLPGGNVPRVIDQLPCPSAAKKPT